MALFYLYLYFYTYYEGRRIEFRENSFLILLLAKDFDMFIEEAACELEAIKNRDMQVVITFEHIIQAVSTAQC